jgi:DNA-binding CsgD family transcriptional regulator/tetratricopeptide (TPR) repeat protein
MRWVNDGWGFDRDAGSELLERERELGAIEDFLDRGGDAGGALLIEGPAGVGKTSLLRRLGSRASESGFRVLSARGSEIDRDFGFGVVRQLFAPSLRALASDERAALFAGPAALAAAIFGLGDPGTLDVSPAEASLYGLFWLLAALAESRPTVISIDDGHWCDTASLRFVHYAARRRGDLPLLFAITARPDEPGPQAELLRETAADLEPTTLTPSLLSEGGTAALVDARLGRAAPAAVTEAAHQATGGNPLLIEEVLAELGTATDDDAPIAPGSIAAVGPRRIADGVLTRSRGLDPEAPDVVRAVAVLGDAADLAVVAALAGVERERAVAIVDLLVAGTILDDEEGRGFVHPVLRTAVHEAIPPAARAAAHARAADLMLEQGCDPEEVAAHVLLCEPGSAAHAVDALDAAARNAAARGAPESAATYLRRALIELPADDPRRGDLLRRLGRAEIVLRDPASIGHLQDAAALVADPELALQISIELGEVLAIAGLWDATVATVDDGLSRFGGSELPGVLDLEAMRAAYRGYDPAWTAEYAADRPRLLATVEGRDDEDSARLRWVLAAIGALQDTPREEILRLIAPATQRWRIAHDGRESSLVAQAASSLVLIDDLAGVDEVATALAAEGRERGSLLAMISAAGYAAAADARRGRLSSSEASLRVTIELIESNELSLMALTTCLHHCVDTLIERRELEPLARMVEEIELPPPFARTMSGAILGEVRGALRIARGDRAAAVEDLRAAEAILRPMGIGPRLGPWRSRLALALPTEERGEAVALVAEELELAAALDAPRALGIAQRALGTLRGGEEGVEELRRSVETLAACPSPLEGARSLAELGAALRRGNSRNEARERLREAADLAQLCGAERLEAQVAEELLIAGAKPRRRRISGPDSLTPAERRVASAAAAGATNREIAQNLFVSLRTVEMHLTNTYRKLGTASRADLATAIAATESG